MEDLFSFLFKANIIIVIFLLCFHALFRNSTFFLLNRIFLLSGLLFSLTIPLISIPSTVGASSHYLYVISGDITDEEILAPSPGKVAPRNWQADMTTGLTWIYFAGMLFFIGRTAVGFRHLSDLMRSTDIRALRHARIVPVKGDKSFAFFNILFLSGNQKSREVVAHEKAHIRQRHWIDITLLEIASIIFWFNPVMLLYRRAMKQQHEFLADQFALNQRISLDKYLLAILSSCGPVKPHELINQFNSNAIKKRIHMMTKNKTPYGQRLLYLTIIPLSCLLFFAFGKKPSHDQIRSNPLTIVIDASHGGTDPGTVAGTFAEKDVSLSVAKIVAELCLEKGIKAVMTRSQDETISLENRLVIAKNAEADLFLSIHLSSDSDPLIHGIGCVVSKENAAYEKSLKAGSAMLEYLKPQMAVNGVKNTNAMVVKNNSSAAVILELGYLSNETDRAFITKDRNQRIVAERIVAALGSLK
jgi:N-acetylmuramoyl-L-alanine amidase